MHPAFSVIFFTTASGAGFGLLSWLGLLAMAHRFEYQLELFPGHRVGISICVSVSLSEPDRKPRRSSAT